MPIMGAKQTAVLPVLLGHREKMRNAETALRVLLSKGFFPTGTTFIVPDSGPPLDGPTYMAMQFLCDHCGYTIRRYP